MNWLVMGLLSTLCFAFYGLFSKLSPFQPAIANLIIFASSGIVGILPVLLIGQKFTYSKEGFLSGICSAGSVLLMLFLLIANQVLVVFSFVSFSSVVFFLIILALEKPALSSKQRILAITGITVSTLGLMVASTSLEGITDVLSNASWSGHYLLIASGIPIGIGLWAYLSFVAMKKVGSRACDVLCSYSFAALAVAVLGYCIFGLSNPLPAFSQFRDFFPVLAGLFLVGGVILTLKAYETTSGESRIEDTIVAILANAEIVPLIFLSYFILGEFTIASFVGAFTVFIGLSILNAARAE